MTIGEKIDQLVAKNDIFILERSLVQACGVQGIRVEIDNVPTYETPGYKAERQRVAKTLERIEVLLEEMKNE